ncbi:MAG: hypothetical protein ACK56F_00430, partial [bacterium]
YTNPGKPEGKRSPPKTTTRPIHKVAVVVPAEYVFEDDTCDNVVGQRCPKRDLELKGEMEAAKAPRKDSAKAKEGEPERGGVQPAARRRRGRPKKAEKPSATGKGLQAGEQGIAGAAAEAGVLQEAGNQIPTTRRGQPRDLGPRKQRDRGRSC